MKYGRVMIAAPKSGSGKTIITCGLLAWLKDRGYKVRSYKCGPDYIDPMFHRQVIGVPGGNLDTFFSDDEELRSQIAASDCGAAVIEGVMGIYDGITGLVGKGSCYDVATATETPVILVMDVKGMGQTMLSVIKGILSDDRKNLIRGIVLNRISERYLGQMLPLIDETLKEISDARGNHVELIGGIPDMKDARLESRHLGLMMPDEVADLEEQVIAARNLIAENLDTEKLLDIMKQAGELTNHGEQGQSENAAGICQNLTEKPSPCQLTLAVARDEAFCFYYEENLRLIESMGIRIREFSPMYSRELPEDADGILLGGGYPELHAEELGDNVRIREAIRSAVQSGMPCLAECGGFMYLMSSITDEKGDEHPMCNVISGTSVNTGKLGRFGYITISENTDGAEAPSDDEGEHVSLMHGLCVRGHEFHYYDSDNNGEDAVAVKPGSGRSWTCMHAGKNYLWGYPHLYYPSCPELIERFRESMLRYNINKNNNSNE